MTLRAATLGGTGPEGTRSGFRPARRTHGHGRYVTGASSHGHGALRRNGCVGGGVVGRYTVVGIIRSLTRALCVTGTHFIAALTHALNKVSLRSIALERVIFLFAFTLPSKSHLEK